MGFRYDARAVSALGLFMGLLIIVPAFNPMRNERSHKFWTWFLTLIWFGCLFFYGADFYHYDYLHQRLSASVLQFLADANISAGMVWETYPILQITFGFIFLFVVFYWLHAISIQYLHKQPASDNKKKNAIVYSFLVLLLALSAFGRVGQYPLRWSDAFVFSDDFKAATAMNPFQSFISTFQFRNDGYDEKAARDAFPRMAAEFGILTQQSYSLNYTRNIAYASTGEQPMNVVLVICESFHAPKSSVFGNNLDPTPFFKTMSQQGMLFNRCFTPAFGTARGVWAIITGIPDISSSQTSSRNPLLVDQHSILNDFNGYEKFYFLGGSTSWANIQGVLKNNIYGLKIYEQDQFKSERVDVWGISDKNLFLESNQILSEQKKPFFAIIQTAGNHRPYTIPAEDLSEFEVKKLSDSDLQRNFFENNEQFNAFRYMDFSISKFMEAAQKEKYFSNTLFVFVGDHGLRGGIGSPFPKVYSEIGISAEHVPLLFYAPGKLNPKRINQVCSQLDVLPSIAGFVNQPHRNTTLGRNLFDSSVNRKKTVFIADPDNGNHTVLNDSFYFTSFTRTGKSQFGSMLKDNAPPDDAYMNFVKKRMSISLGDWQNTSRYLLFNNKKR